FSPPADLAAPPLPSFPTRRSSDLVGLDAFDHEQRPAVSTDQLVQRFNLARQIVRHRLSVRFVLGIPIVAECFSGCIEDHGEIVRDRKSTRLNSSHDQISYAVFCLK